MAFRQPFIGNPTITTTEYSIVTGSTVGANSLVQGVYTAFFDFSLLAAADSYRVRIYEKATPTSTKRIVHDITVTGVQSEPIYVTPSLFLMNGWDITVVKVAGTDRAIPYSVRQVS